MIFDRTVIVAARGRHVRHGRRVGVAGGPRLTIPPVAAINDVARAPRRFFRRRDRSARCSAGGRPVPPRRRRAARDADDVARRDLRSSASVRCSVLRGDRAARDVRPAARGALGRPVRAAGVTGTIARGERDAQSRRTAATASALVDRPRAGGDGGDLRRVGEGVGRRGGRQRHPSRPRDRRRSSSPGSPRGRRRAWRRCPRSTPRSASGSDRPPVDLATTESGRGVDRRRARRRGRPAMRAGSIVDIGDDGMLVFAEEARATTAWRWANAAAPVPQRAHRVRGRRHVRAGRLHRRDPRSFDRVDRCFGRASAATTRTPASTSRDATATPTAARAAVDASWATTSPTSRC